MTDPTYPYSHDVIRRLHERAEGYRQSGPSAAHTADLLDEAAGCIATLIGDVYAYRMTFKRIMDDEAALSSATGSAAQAEHRDDQDILSLAPVSGSGELGSVGFKPDSVGERPTPDRPRSAGEGA